jgi:hypothetical protein
MYGVRKKGFSDELAWVDIQYIGNFWAAIGIVQISIGFPRPSGELGEVFVY